MVKTFFEHDKTSDATVAILERVYGFKLLVKVEYVREGCCFIMLSVSGSVAWSMIKSIQRK